MESMMAYMGNNLLNLVAAKFYQAQRNKFKGSGSASGVQYSFDVAVAPVGKLLPNQTTHNLQFDLTKVKVDITVNPLPRMNRDLSMTATGKLAISGGVLSLTGLKVSINNPGFIDRAIQQAINTQVVPKIAQALAGIPIPQLEKIFGSTLSAGIRSGNVINGPAFELGARISGRTGIAAADAPVSASISSLNSGTATNALLIGMVSGGAADVLAKALTPAISEPFDKRGTKAGFGAGIKGTMKATPPSLSIAAAKGKITTRVSITSFKAGIKAPLLSFKWVPIPVPDTNVIVTNTLAAEGRKGVITLTGVESIKVSINWPTILKPVEVVVKTLLNGVLSLFRGTISNKVSGKKIVLFELPATVPGTAIGAALSFDGATGLKYFKSSVQATVRVKA